MSTEMSATYQKIWGTPADDPARALYPKYPALEEAETSVNHRTDGRYKLAKNLLPKGGIGAEIGVFTGLFSPHLFEATEPTRMYLVDPWGSMWGDTYPAWGAYTAFGKLTTQAAMDAVKARTKKFGDKVEMIVGTSMDWLPKLPNNFLDWVYLDSSHAYLETIQELALIAPKLRPGGVVMCDDCRPDPKSKHHSVFRAVRDFTKMREFEVFHMEQGQGFIRRSIY